MTSTFLPAVTSKVKVLLEVIIKVSVSSKMVDLFTVDSSTFYSRLKHFTRLTSPANLIASRAKILHAQTVVDAYKRGVPFPARFDVVPGEHWYTPEELIKCKYLVDASIHPDTGVS